MSKVFNGSEKLGEIVNEFPGASNVFKEYKIDFCCGGNRPLTDAIEKQNLNAEEVLAKLNQAYSESVQRSQRQVDWREESSSNLIDHVVDKHHGYCHREMPLLSEFTTKILRVHGANHIELATVHRLFHQVKLELEQHLITEETILFPKIKEYEQNPTQELYDEIVNLLEKINQEHDQAGEILREIREVTNDYYLPPDACRTYSLTYQKLQDFESDLFEHIHLENNVLFPRFSK